MKTSKGKGFKMAKENNIFNAMSTVHNEHKLSAAFQDSVKQTVHAFNGFAPALRANVPNGPAT